MGVRRGRVEPRTFHRGPGHVDSVDNQSRARRSTDRDSQARGHSRGGCGRLPDGSLAHFIGGVPAAHGRAIDVRHRRVRHGESRTVLDRRRARQLAARRRDLRQRVGTQTRRRGAAGASSLRRVGGESLDTAARGFVGRSRFGGALGARDGCITARVEARRVVLVGRRRTPAGTHARMAGRGPDDPGSRWWLRARRVRLAIRSGSRRRSGAGAP